MTSPKKYPLHLVLTVSFAILILMIGSFIGALNYIQIKKLVLSAADEIYEKVSDQIVLNHRVTYNPVRNAINLLSHSLLAESKTPEQRLNHVSLLVSAMNAEKSVVAIQLGYENGDFFIVRKLNTKEIKKKFDSPAAATTVVDSSSINKAGRGQLVRLFFDQQLNLIQKNEPVISQFDPRLRPWFRQATRQPKAIAPYYFHFMEKVGTTVTMKMFQSNAVIAADITLENVSKGLNENKMTMNSELYLITTKGNVVASSNADEVLISDNNGEVVLKKINELESDVFINISASDLYKENALNFLVDGSQWKGAVKKIGKLGEDELYLFMFTPVRELLKEAISIGWNTLLLLLAIILLTVPLIWFLSKRISAVMQQVAMDSKKIMNFDFSSPVLSHSKVEEVDDLLLAQNLMKTSLSRFMGLINTLSSEKDFDSLLEKITAETLQASNADAVITYLLDADDKTLSANSIKAIMDTEGCDLPEFTPADDYALSELINSKDCRYLLQYAGSKGEWSCLLKRLNKGKVNNEKAQLFLLPLRNRQSQFIGMIMLVYARNTHLGENNQNQVLSFIQAFSGFAAVSLESKQLLKTQEDLLDSFIMLIAGAIDAKSPYTGGHCQRVPELTKMLAQAACDSSETIFSDYQLNDDEWKEIHIASWLHDCGKVTTPEYVVDKATKLETIHDRIHEIRTRFEVLQRDAEIKYWRGVAGGQDESILKEKLIAAVKQLNDDFQFVANCNLGGEFMEDKDIQRLQQISQIRWMRTFDDRLGVSWEEQLRMERVPVEKLPVEEKLLDDKGYHIIKRSQSEIMREDNPWGFKLNVPEYKFNRGELYNLSVARGTLTDEERFIINDHMVQTIKMLDKLPYPRFLKNVPLIAGCHHETMDGKGYPKRLTKEDMPLTARMMAIADIFEALTASDRPYKKAKTLNEALRILSFMRNDKHIDSDLFDLFLTSGVYLKYAKEFLPESQIDTVDIQKYLSV